MKIIDYLEQPDPITCGNTALCMISNHYKLQVSIYELKHIMDTTPEYGTTDIHMKRGLDYLNMDYLQFKENPFEQLHDCLNKGGFVLLRCLVQDIKHWLVCSHIEDGKYYILDSWLGESLYTYEELVDVWKPRDYDGFCVYGVNKVVVETVSIEKITEENIPNIISMASAIYANVMTYENNYKFIESSLDANLSHQLIVNGELAGFYFLRESAFEEDIFKGMNVLEGLGLGIHPKFRNLGLGSLMINWMENYAFKNNYHYIVGGHSKKLNNLHYWEKRRSILNKDKLEGVVFTYKKIK